MLMIDRRFAAASIAGRRVRLVRPLLLLVLLLAAPGGAQKAPPMTGGEIQRSTTAGFGDGASDFRVGDAGRGEEVRRLHLLNIERQKSMVSDADKLLNLATDLNSRIGKQSTEPYTPDEMRKVAQIEKLARNVKEAMTFSVQAPPAYQEPSSAPLGRR